MFSDAFLLWPSDKAELLLQSKKTSYHDVRNSEAMADTNHVQEKNEESMNGEESTTEDELDDLNSLNFPGEVDWSTTLVLRCDPEGSPYRLTEVIRSLHNIVRRNQVYSIGSTSLSHAFTISFRTTGATEGFVRFLKTLPDKKELKVKGRPCLVSRVPAKYVNVMVRWIPVEVDSVYVVDELKKYGTVVKTELCKSNVNGWYHALTSDRRVHLFLKEDIGVNDLPFGIYVKGLLAGVKVEERTPKCLDCFYSGHVSESCKYEGCPLYVKGSK